MLAACLLLALAAFMIALTGLVLLIRISHRLGALDTPAMTGQVKMARRQVPNTGGIAIVLAVGLPMAGILTASLIAPDLLISVLHNQDLASGLRDQAPAGLWLLGGVLAIHALGLVDDRVPLPPIPKLLVILAVSLAVVMLTRTRLLELLDPVAGGAWLSITITVLWFGVVTNAMNFMDNMDGVSTSAGLIASACLMSAMLLTGHWFVAGLLALLAGALSAFLIFNFPPARIFMGDGGSLVVGFLLAFSTTRGTYYAEDLAIGAAPHAVLMPLIVLAIPLYDFTSVTLVRISQGKSPFKGDLQHFSHRLRRRGLGARQTVGVIAGLSAACGLGAIVFMVLPPWGAILLGFQTLILLLVLAVLERGSVVREESFDA